MQCEPDHMSKAFFVNTYFAMFHYINYNPALGFAAKVISYFVSFTWAYRDLFIVNIAFALKVHFAHFNRMIYTSDFKEASKDFWWLHRSNYSKLLSLVGEVDNAINGITFLSLVLN